MVYEPHFVYQKLLCTSYEFDRIKYIALYILKIQVIGVTLILKALYNLSWVYSLDETGE